MAALALSAAFFLYLAVVGRAALELCRWRGGVLRSWLLAPAAGLAVAVLGIMILNQAGWPVGRFAWPLALALGIMAGVTAWWRRPLLPGRALLPFAACGLATLLWTGWPAFEFGFRWISYVNDDFTNYCFAAERFRDYSFWRIPTMPELAGRDYAHYFWFMHVPGLMRFGSEHIVAWVAALSGRKALEIFMPVILALGLVQLFACAGLVLHFGRWRRRALIACALLAISPLFMLGTLYQLIAQVGGLSLMLAAAAVSTARLPSSHTRRILPTAIALAILSAALCVYYPETTPFVGLVAIGYAVIEAMRRRTFPQARLRLALYTVIGIAFLLRYNLFSYVFTILQQFAAGVRQVDLKLSLFPYFMIPSGLADLFGLMPLAVNTPEPATSIAILAGALALLLALGFALRESFRPAPAALLLLVQFFVALWLLFGGNDFGLYKDAMFMQPALLAALAGIVAGRRGGRWRPILTVAVFAGFTASTALWYTKASLGLKAGGITEAKLASVLGTDAPVTPPHTRLLCDISNLVAAKVAALETRGIDLRFLSRDYYQQISVIDFERFGRAITLHPHYADLVRTRPMLADRDALTIHTDTVFQTEFRAPALAFADVDANDAYLTLDPSLGLFNKFDLPPDARPTAFFHEIPAGRVHNHLVFVHSGRGNHYYLGDRHRIGLYQEEADPYGENQDFAGLGRFLLLRVEQPDAEFYLRLAATKTFLGLAHTAWPKTAQILGATNLPLGVAGNGAINRIIGPIRPQWRDGAAYIAIDFSETPMQFPFQRHGLQALYNTQVPLDSRLLVAYARDISALSAAQVAALDRPSRLVRFPADLVSARGLEFSGIYEDGWLSPQSEFVLAGTGATGCVRLRGVVPVLTGSALGRGMLHATLNGRDFALPAATGAFDWLLPMPASARTAHVALEFTATAILPGGDDRPIGGKLELIDVLPALPMDTFDFGTPGGLRPAAPGVDPDGWFDHTAALSLPASEQPRELVLEVEFPGWAGAGEASLDIQTSDTTKITRQALRPGVYTTVRIPLAAATGPQTVHLTTSAEFSLPAPDGRRRSARLVRAGLRPAAPERTATAAKAAARPPA